MNEPCSIGVVVACYHGEKTLAATLDGVLAQTRQDWRLVIVDDGSPDQAAAIASAYVTRDSRIELLRTPNRGVCAARNLGFSHLPPETRFVQFLDQDDVPEPHAFARFTATLEARPEAGMVHCEPRLIDASGSPITERPWMPRWAAGRFWPRPLPAGDDGLTPLESIYCGAGLVPSLCVYRRSALVAAGLFDEDLGQCYEDVNLNITVALRGPVLHLADQLVRYRVHEGQVSRDEARIARQEKRLYAKWTVRRDLPPAQLAQLSQAERFRRGPLALRLALIAGKLALRSGRLGALPGQTAIALRAALRCARLH
jgi:glycosyltransferase involved in cell wall biosynthesis